jgi:hypothetical protein
MFEQMSRDQLTAQIGQEAKPLPILRKGQAREVASHLVSESSEESWIVEDGVGPAQQIPRRDRLAQVVSKPVDQTGLKVGYRSVPLK